jgi:putative transport protein
MQSILDTLGKNDLITLMLVMSLGTLLGQVRLGPIRLGPAGGLFLGLAVGACR